MSAREVGGGEGPKHVTSKIASATCRMDASKIGAGTGRAS
jgi:hypothetical protein